ncbi:MAG: hypothetical protein IJ097_02570 [Bacilli bacterium]|nr:hypothetical protein [Bacilli bacterium]
MNKVFKLLGIVIIILFLSLYFSKYNNEYYENKNDLTEEAIKKYEKDLKEGKKIIPSEYIPKEKDYNNTVSRMGMKASRIIEKIINNSVKYAVKYIDNSS